MPIKVGLSTGRWNDQEFDLCPYRTCMSEQFNLIHLELAFVSFRCLLLWMSSCGLQHKFFSTNSPEYFLQVIVCSTEILEVFIQFELFL